MNAISTISTIGAAAAVPGRWVWEPLAAPWAIALLAGGAIVLTLIAYRRAARQNRRGAILLATVRVIALLGLAVVLCGPSRLPADTPRAASALRPTLGVLLDTSGSMATADVNGRPRLAALVEGYLTPASLAEMRRRFDVRLYEFDESPRPMTDARLEVAADGADPDAAPADAGSLGSSSRYAESIRRVIGDVAPGDVEAGTAGAALLILGDGHDSDGSPPGPVAQLAERHGVAIHTLLAGSTRSPPDLSVAAIARPASLFAGEQGRIIAEVRRIGETGGQAALRISGPDIEETRTVTFDETGRALVEIPIGREEPGSVEYVLTIEPIAGEAVTANNTQSVFVDVARRRASVLLLEGEPHWDTRFIAQALRLDGRVRLVQVSRVTESRRERITAGGIESEAGDDSPDSAPPGDEAADPPRDVDEWAGFDVVILGRRIERLLDERAVAGLVEWVTERGGGLILARGRAWDERTAEGRRIGGAIRAIEPVERGEGERLDLSVHATAAGRTHPMLSGGRAGPGSDDDPLADLPPLRRIAHVDSLRAGAITLVETRDSPGGMARPVLIEMNIGRGRVLAVLGEGLWRWRLLPESQGDIAGFHDALWTSAVRTLASGADLSPGLDIDLRLPRTAARIGEPVVVEVVARRAGEHGDSPLDSIAIELTGPDGVVRSLKPAPDPASPHRRWASFTADRVGVYTAAISAPADAPAQPGSNERIERRLSVYDPSLERLDTAARPDYLRALAEATGGRFFVCGQEADLPLEIARAAAANADGSERPRPVPVWDRWPPLVGLLGWLGLEWLARRRFGWA